MAVSRRSDIEVLSRSVRSRILLLALLIAAGLGAALWTGTRDAGLGAPEDRRRLMVVTHDHDINYAKVLERAGFAFEVERFSVWEAEARELLPESEAEGVGLVLELADQRGFGLVVFENPGEFDLDGLESEPALASIERLAERDYLVLSVGDYGFPHRASFDDSGPHPIVRLPGYAALEAVFRQDLIHARGDRDRPTVEELQFESAIRFGRRMIAQPAEFAVSIAAERAAIEATLDDGSGAHAILGVEPRGDRAPRELLATGSPIPTPDGGILLVHHELVIYSDDARSLALEAATHMQLAWIGPAAVAAGIETGEFELEPCPSLSGGVLTMAEQPRIETAVDGSLVAISTLERGTSVWRKTGAPGCEWEAVAELDLVRAGLMTSIELAPRLAGGDRILAAGTEQYDASSRVLVWVLAEPGAGAGAGNGAGNGAGSGAGIEPQVLIDQADRRFADLALIDDRHLAVVSDLIPNADPDADPEARVYLLDRTRPGLYLSVPLEFFAPGRTLRELVALSPATPTAGPELLVSAQNPDGRAELIRLRIGVDAWDAFAREQLGEIEVEFGVEGRMVSLTPEDLEATIVTEVDNLYGLSIGAGPRVAYSFREGAGPGELALLDLDTGATRRLTTNAVRDYLPRIAADGSYATFVSLLRVSLSTTAFSVPRLLAL